MRRHDSSSTPPGGCGPLDLPLVLRRLLAALVLVLLCFLPARVLGDWVITKDEHDAEGELFLTQIAEKFERTAHHLRHLTLQSSNGQTQTIPTTNEHPAYVPELGLWIRAADVEVGQSLNELPGSQSLVTATRQETHRQGGVKVYNMKLREGHTYFVRERGSTAEPVWVHNEYTQLEWDWAPQKAPKSLTQTLTEWLRGNRSLLEETRNWFENRPDWWSIDPDNTPVFYRSNEEVEAIRALSGESGGHHPHGLALGGPRGQTLTWTGDSRLTGVNPIHAQVTGLQQRVINVIRSQIGD